MYEKKKFNDPSSSLILATFLLCVFGVISTYSASAIKSNEAYGFPFAFVFKQIFGIVVGFFAIAIIQKFPKKTLDRIPLPFFILTSIVLSLILIPNLYETAGGASRWLRLGFITIQPAELAKLSFVLIVAKILSRKSFEISNIYSVILNHSFILLLLTYMLMKQPDFGSTFVLYSLLFVMLFYAGLKTKHIAIGLGFLVPLCAWAVFSAPYRVKRILGFLNPWENMSREGFQIVQSFLAFQNGGLFGVGLGNSKQKLFYLPEAHTDFILSIIAEEVGSIGIFIVLALYSYIIYLGYLISQRAQNYYYKTLAFGITTLLGLQSILNMGVALGMLPTKGMTLPFISSGTSSLLTCLVAVGLLARIGHKTKEEKNEFR